MEFSRLTELDKDLVRETRVEIYNECERFQHGIDEIRELLPQIQNYRMHVQSSLVSGVALLDPAAVYLDEIKTTGTFSETLELLHPAKGQQYFDFVRKTLRDHALLRVLEVIDKTRLPVTSAHQVGTKALRDYCHIRIHDLGAKGEWECDLDALNALWDRVWAMATDVVEKQSLMKGQLVHALKDSEEAWAAVKADMDLADPSIRTSNDAATVFKEAFSVDLATNPLDTFVQMMYRPYRASLVLFATSHVEQRSKLNDLKDAMK